ncbi:MAG: hypothetical protein ACAH11_04605 [Sphingomonas sp.]
MNVLMGILFALGFSEWSLLGAVVIGFLVARRRGVRGPTVLVLAAVPLLVIFVTAWMDGCYHRTDCMTGFGVVLAIPMGLYLAVCAVVGIGLRYLAGRLISRTPPSPPPSPAPPS